MGTMREYGNIADRTIKQHYTSYGTAEGWSDGYAFTAPVGSFLPNYLGLYDMHANVYEWCQDWFAADYYEDSPTIDPQGPKKGTERIQRGGSFFHHVENSRSAQRDSNNPSEAASCNGFRVLLEPRVPDDSMP